MITKVLKNTLLFITLVSLFQLSTGSDGFNMVDPILWDAVDIPHIAGQKEWHLRVVIMNPCPKLFSNMTSSSLMDKMIIDNCTTRFKELIMSEVDKLCPTGGRRKRFVFEIVSISAIAVTALVAGSASYAEINTREKLEIVVAREKEIIESTNNIIKQIEELKSNYLASSLKTAAAIDKLADDVDFLTQIAQIQPSVAELISITYIKMSKAGALLGSTIEKTKVLKIVPKELFELINATNRFNPTLEKLSKYTKCTRLGEYELDFEFTTVTRSEDVTVYKSDPFEFYKVVNGSSCLHKYNGHEYVLFNSTSDCMVGFKDININKDSIRGIGCSTRKKLDVKNDTWVLSDCIEEAKANRSYRMIKQHGAMHVINCQGLTINTNHEERKCPDYCFSLPTTESFSIGDYEFSHQSINMMSKVTLESTAPSRINLQMKTRGMNFGEQIRLTIKPIQEMSNISVLEQSKNETDSIMQQLTDKVNNIAKTSIGDGFAKIQTIFTAMTTVVIVFGILAILSILKPIVMIFKSFILFPLGMMWSKLSESGARRRSGSSLPQYARLTDQSRAPLGFRKRTILPIAIVLLTTISCSEAYRKDVPSIQVSPASKEEAMEEIETLRNLIKTLCEQDKNRFFGERVYVAQLACAMAKRAYNCQCIPLSERVPILNDENSLKFNTYDRMSEIQERLEQVTNAKTVTGPSVREKLNKGSI